LRHQGHACNGFFGAEFEALGHEMQYIRQQHQQDHTFIACNKVEENLRLEVGGNLRQHLSYCAQIRRAEEDPTETNEVERDDYACNVPAAP